MGNPKVFVNGVDLNVPNDITIEHPNDELKRMEELTWGELFKLWGERHPELKDSVSDYRPAKGLLAIQVWFNNGTSNVYKYQSDTDTFTVS